MRELTRRYIVMSMATEGPFDLRDRDAAFVLKPWKDPAALAALDAYRQHCYPELASELTVWIGEISSGPRVRGGIGARNEAHAAASAKSRPAGAPKTKKAGAPGKLKARAEAVRRKKPKKKAKR